MPSVRLAVIYSSLMRFGMRTIGLVSSMIVARLLSPDEIGTYAIASSIVMIMVEFRLLGAGNYLIREQTINTEKVRTALGLTILISWGLGIIILLGSSGIADFFNIPQLQYIFSILAVSFFVAPYISIPTALLSKEMAFKTQFYIRMVSSVIGLVSTVVMIYAGLSFYSLAIGQSLATFSQFIILLFIKPSNMVYLPQFKGLKIVAKFGIFNSTALLIRKASVTIPDIIIGKMGTTAEVGLFSRGIGFIEFVSQTVLMGVQPVSLPYLSKTLKQGGDVKTAYIKSSVMLGAIVLPILGVASVASLPAIRLFFGDQWDAAAPFASWLAIWAMFRTLHWFSNDLLMAVGKEKLMLAKELIPFILLFFLIIYSYPYGLEAIAKSFIIVGVVDFLITSYFLFQVIQLSLFDFIKYWWSNLALLASCWLAATFIQSQVPFDTTESWLVILILLATLPIVWVVTLAVCKNPLYFELLNIIKRRF